MVSVSTKKRMKAKLLIFLFTLAGLSALADDLSLKDGTVLHNVIVVSADAERMLIVHDGGGCQVYYKDLARDSLTEAQRNEIAVLMKEHVERTARIEQLRLEKEIFEKEQREKGLILFEGNWVSPAQQEEILANRKNILLEQERLKIELAKKEEELLQQQLETERARYLLNETERNVYYVGYSSSRSCWPRYVHRSDTASPCKTYGYVPRLRQKTYPSTCNTTGPFYTSRSTGAALKSFNR